MGGIIMKYKIIGYTKIEVKTIVEAKTEEEAEQIARDREIMICIHGTDDSECEDEWVFVDAPDMVDVNYTEEL